MSIGENNWMREKIQTFAEWSWNHTTEWKQELFVTLVAQSSLTNRNSSKYSSITNILMAASTFNPLARLLPWRPVGLFPGLHVSYHFCRIIDDIADGDANLPQEYEHFSDLATALKEAMAKEIYPPSHLGILLRGTVRDIRTYHHVDIREELSQFIDAMNYEHERRTHTTVSTQEELYHLYQNSFKTPQDISFICIGSKLRSINIPELAEVQGRIYAVRDLADELAKNIIFIPKEVFPDELLASDFCRSYQTSPELIDWIQHELKEGKRLVTCLREKKLDWKARVIVNFLINDIDRYIQKRESERFT